MSATSSAIKQSCSNMRNSIELNRIKRLVKKCLRQEGIAKFNYKFLRTSTPTLIRYTTKIMSAISPAIKQSWSNMRDSIQLNRIKRLVKKCLRQEGLNQAKLKSLETVLHQYKNEGSPKFIP